METFSALLALCERNPPVTGGFPSKRPVTRSFDAFFDRRMKKRLNKQSRRRWFETSSRSLWRHCYGVLLWLGTERVYQNLFGLYHGCPWWRYQMETPPALLALCEGNSPVTGEFSHKGQWHRTLMYCLIRASINGRVNNREAGYLRGHLTQYDVNVMVFCYGWLPSKFTQITSWIPRQLYDYSRDSEVTLNNMSK